MQFTPSKDNTLIEVPLGNSNGRGELYAGRVRFNQDQSIRRALMAFDLSPIPAGSTVTDVSLAMTVSRARGGNEPMTLHRVSANWGEGTSSGGGRGSGAQGQDATWMQRLPSTAWGSAGGDFTGSASATTSVAGPGTYNWTSAGMLSDVQSWLATPATNFGWILRGNESWGGTVKRFNSKDSGGSAPVLTVTFTEPANLTLTIAADSIAEGNGTTVTTATVSRNTSTSSALVVNLSSSDTGEATVPGSVTIAAGQSASPAFNVTAVDDAIVDGTQTVTITGSSSGYVDGTDTIDVTDDDVLPAATGQEVNGEGNLNRSRVLQLSVKFDQPVTVSAPTSLKLIHLPTGQQIDLSAATLQNNGSMEVTWNLANVVLPTGDYTAELLTTGAASTAGENPLARSHAFSFHVQPGDSSGDRSVNFVDFGEMAANFGQSVGLLGPGDFDGNGLVNFGDFGILSIHFGVALPSLAIDFGDAPPEVSYPTTLVEDGARHVVGSLFLGALVDGEVDGKPSVNASGDDDAGDDEDGVTLANVQAGANATATVITSGVGVLNAWIDYNADGDWDDVGEQVFVDQALTAGENNLVIDIPTGATVGGTFARFRLTTSGGYSYTGLAPDGEVEDYAVSITAASSAPSFASSLRPSRSWLITDWVDAANGLRPLASAGDTAAVSGEPRVPTNLLVDQAVEEMSSQRPSRRSPDSRLPLDDYLVDEVIATELDLSQNPL